MDMHCCGLIMTTNFWLISPVDYYSELRLSMSLENTFFLLHFYSKILSFTHSEADVSMPAKHRAQVAKQSIFPPNSPPSPKIPKSNIQYPIRPAEVSISRGGDLGNPGLVKRLEWNQKEHPCMSESANSKSTPQRSQNLPFPQ